MSKKILKQTIGIDWLAIDGPNWMLLTFLRLFIDGLACSKEILKLPFYLPVIFP
jgi:hypothetical protein